MITEGRPTRKRPVQRKHKVFKRIAMIMVNSLTAIDGRKLGVFFSWNLGILWYVKPFRSESIDLISTQHMSTLYGYYSGYL